MPTSEAGSPVYNILEGVSKFTGHIQTKSTHMGRGEGGICVKMCIILETLGICPPLALLMEALQGTWDYANSFFFVAT